MNQHKGDVGVARRAPRIFGLAVVVVGLTVLLGWALDAAALMSVVPGSATMKPNTAACFILSGLSLALAGRPARRASGRLAGLSLAVALASVAEYLTGLNLGFDELLFSDPVSRGLGLPPGRMSLATGLAFLLIDSALLLVVFGRSLVVAQSLTFAGALVPVFFLLAYLFGERDITLTSPYSTVALNTAAAFAALGAGVLCLCSREGPMAVFFARDAGGTTLRRLMPLTVATTLLLGFLTFLGAKAGRYDFAVGMILFAVLGSVALVVVTWLNAASLRRSEAARHRADEWFRATLRSIGDAVIATDPVGRVNFLNDVAERLTGWTSAEAAGRMLEEVFSIFDEGTGERTENPVTKALETGLVVGLSNHTVLASKDGTRTSIEDSAAPIADDDGEVLGVVLVFRDATAKRRDELAAEEHQRQTTNLLESITDAFVAFDKDWRITYANDLAARLVGLTREEMLGKDHWELFPAALDSPVEVAYRRVAERREIVEFETRYEPWGRWFSIKAAPEKDGGVVAYFREITEQKRTDEALAQARADTEQQARQFEATLSSVRDFVFALDRDERFLYANRAILDLWGVPAEAAIGRSMRELGYPDSTRSRVAAHVRRVFETGLAVSDEVPYRSPAGADGYYEYTLAPVLDAAGTVVQVAGSARDTTQRRAAEEALRENDRRKDEFLAMLAHELRNPLSAISNAVTVTARSGGLREHIDWSMDVISRQMKHLTRLIDDLLEVSRITQGKIELRREVMDITPILESAAATVGQLIAERKHRLEVDFDRGDLWAQVDPTRIEQVAVNLLNNAAKYSEDAGRIRFSARNRGKDLVIAVADEGVGIPPERVSQMFELFAQGDRSLARSEGGLGIGLTVVKKLVEMHGGTVAATSAGPGKGSVFTVRLPASVRGVARTPEAVAPAGGERRASRIVVVDDNVDTARGMGRLLKLLGHEVSVAHSGPEGIEAARRQRPDYVLLDIGLPGMDGYEVAARLRGEEFGKDAVIIAISGYGQEEDRRRSKEAGFDHHLIKPLDHDALLTLLAARP